MSSAPGFQGSISWLLNLVKLMFNSDQIPSVITAEKIWRTGVFQIWRATSPAGWSQLQKVQQTIAPPRPNTLIKGAGRAWEPAVLTLECFLQLPLMSVWGSRSGLEPACLYPENSGKDSAGASLAGLLPLTQASLAVFSLHSSCLRFQHWPAAHEPPQMPPRDLLLLPQLQAQDKFPEQMHLFPQNS